MLWQKDGPHNSGPAQVQTKNVCNEQEMLHSEFPDTVPHFLTYGTEKPVTSLQKPY